jgi:8-oxo-dGTP pyrophosphatase MutT (NUDIX family)
MWSDDLKMIFYVLLRSMSEYSCLDECVTLPHNMQKIQLDLSAPNLMRTMKAVELAHWDYLDNYVHHAKGAYYPHMKIVPFLECLMWYNKVPIVDAALHVKAYDRYKKTVPTAGVVLYCGCMFVVIRMRSSLIWSMPKGKSEEGEELTDTASREFCEETGIELSELITRETPKRYIHKSTFYFVEADHMQTTFTGYNTNEVMDVKWVSTCDVLHDLTHYSKQTVAVADELQTMLSSASPVVER